VLAINLLKEGNAWLASMGRVSYSLYSLHGSIGSFVLYVMLAYVVGDSQIGKAFAVLFSLGVSLGAAALSYKFIEKPAIKYGGTLEYAPSESEALALMSLPLAGATVSVKEG
jgi:peptidoglycan/LPS O-acetylase OafA/YrhL